MGPRPSASARTRSYLAPVRPSTASGPNRAGPATRPFVKTHGTVSSGAWVKGSCTATYKVSLSSQSQTSQSSPRRPQRSAWTMQRKRAPEVELIAHQVRKSERGGRAADNARIGMTFKAVQTEVGPVPLQVPTTGRAHWCHCRSAVYLRAHRRDPRLQHHEQARFQHAAQVTRWMATPDRYL
jgi:hypothetical protein